MVTPSRKIHPSVENSDTYMWSSTKTWLRSMDKRSRYSGRSWCAICPHGRLQPRHVGLERDGHLVAEAPLHARADRAQKPGCGGRYAQGRSPPLASTPSGARESPSPAAPATRQAGHRAAPPAATRRTTPPSAAVRGDSPACTAATSTKAPAAEVPAQTRDSYVVPSSSGRWKRCACRSNIVR